MRWAGVGSELWRVRVDLFADDAAGERAVAVRGALVALLVGDGADDGAGEVCADQGTGASHQPVVGMLFWVRADDVGAAASLAVETATRAGAAHGVGPGLYDVTIIPSDAVVFPGDPHYPAMPD